jgi:hypothetical protein
MTEWWDALRLDLQIFYGIGILATLVLSLQFVMMFFGFGDHDVGGGQDVHVGDTHVDHGGAHVDGLHVVSIRTITAFFFGFGWSGALGIREGFSTLVATLIAFVVGIAFMAIVYSLMRLIYSLRASGTVNYRNAIGVVGDVYVTVPAKQSGAGQVQITVQGRMRVVAALTRADHDLTGGSKIKVVELVDERTLLVEPLGDSKPG